MANEQNTGVDIVELFTDSVDVFREHWMQFVVGALVVIAFQALTGFLFIASLLLTGPMIMGLFKMSLCGVRREPVLLGDAFCGFDYFVQAVFLNLVVVLLALPGFLCILPGVFVFVLLLPSYFFLLDGTPGITESLRLCRQMITSDLRSWLWIGGYGTVLLVVGLMTFGIGLIVTLPITLISLAFAYDRIRSGRPLSGGAPSDGDVS